MIKSFDCVDMKQKAGKVLSKKLNKMSVQDQLKFWQEKHNNLLVKKNSFKRKDVIKKANRLKKH